MFASAQLKQQALTAQTGRHIAAMMMPNLRQRQRQTTESA
jgi:hypothetical protein